MSFHVRIRSWRLMAAMSAMLVARIGWAHPTITWKDVGADLADAANWVEAVSPDLNAIVKFDAVAPTHQPTLAAAGSAYGLVFASGAGAFTLSGAGPLTIGDSGITNCNTTLVQTISVPLVLAPSESSFFWIKNDGALTISGTVTNSAGDGLKLAGPGLNGAVSGGISGTKDVIKYDGGTWTLSGANTFSGKLRVEDGALILTGTSTTTDVSVSSDATLNLNAANTLAPTADVYVYGLGRLNVNFSNTIAALESGISGAQAMVDVASGATLTIEVGNGGAEVFEGVISGAGSVAKSGSGQQTFSGLSTYTGKTTISGGVLTVSALANGGAASGVGQSSNAAANLVLDGGTLQYNGGSAASTDRLFTLGSGGGTIDTSGGGAITFSSAGAIAFATANTSATLQLDSGSAVTNTFNPVIGDNGTGVTGLRKNGIGTWVLGSANTFTGATDVAFGTLTLANSAALQASAVSVGATGALTFTGITSATLGSLAGTKGIALQNDAGTPAALALAVGGNNGSTMYSGVLSGAGSLAKTGTGTFTLSGTNTYTGGTLLNGGTLLVSSDVNLGDAAGGLTFNGGTLQAASGFTSARGVTLNAGGGTIDTHTYQLTLSGVVTGTGKLTHQGTGVLTLSGANNYAGGTVVKGGGVLDFTSDANLGTGGVELSGGFLRTQAAIADFSHDILLGSGGGNLNTNGFNSTFSGRFSGTGGLTVQSQTGNGVLTLTNAGNQWAGTTTVDSGTLKIGADDALGSLGTGTVTVAAGAKLDVSANQSVNSLSGAGTIEVAASKVLTIKTPGLFGAVVSGSGGVTFANNNNSTGFTTLTASQTYTGTTTLTTGSLQLGNGTAPVSLAGPVVLGSGSTLGFSHGSGNSTYSQPISGGGSLMKNNSGTLTLTGSNSYTGSTTVAGGALKAGAANALPSGTGLALGAGTTLDVAASQTINRFLTTDATSSILLEAGQTLTVALGGNPGAGTQFNGTISGAGALKISDAGTFTVALTGDNTYTGGTTIDANAGLWIGTGGTKGMITGNVVNNGTLLFARTDNVTFGGVISGSGVVKQTTGSGTLEFTAANTYNGGTLLYGWLLAKNSSGSATGTGSVAIYSGGMLGGNGTVSGPVSVNSGGTIGPGTALGIPAELHVGNTTFKGDGVFAFQIKDATGSAGSGYSLLSSSGSLTINATSGNPFIISVYSVNGSTQGTTANFDSTVGYSWTFVSAANGVTGFDAAAFQVSTANFQNAFAGSFGVSQAGNSLLLNYTPAAVPEPATWALLGLGLGGVWWWRRRGVATGRGR